MKPTQRTAQVLSPQTGIFTTLHVSLDAHGSGASGPTRRGTSVLARILLGLLALLAAVAVGLSGAGSANAATTSPGWTIDSLATPTNFAAASNATCQKEVTAHTPGLGCDAYQVDVTNAGEAASSAGAPLVITDRLPQGVTPVPGREPGEPEGEVFFSAHPQANLASLAHCTTTPATATEGSVVSCDIDSNNLNVVAPDGTIQLVIYVTVDEPQVSGPVTNHAEVSGAGAPPVSVSRENAISSAQAPFGFSNFEFYISGSDGVQDTQAGDHPYEVTTTIDLNNTVLENKRESPILDSVQDPKDFVADLPLGFVASTLAAPQCTLQQLSSVSECPPDTRVGHITTEPTYTVSVDSPIWNLTPERGSPGEFGYVDAGKNTHIFYGAVVPSPHGYVLQVTNPDTPQIALTHISVTFYGDPAAKQEEFARLAGREPSATPHIPFFTNPTSCENGSLLASIHVDSWQNPGTWKTPGHDPEITTTAIDGSSVALFSGPGSNSGWVGASSESPPVAGCNALRFTPELGAQPTTQQADTPSGLEFELKLAQSETAGTLATPALKTTVVNLPGGMTVDPSSADGLGVCSEAQIGYEGPSLVNFSPTAPSCPASSKIGSLELETPLIPHKLYGEIYLAAQNENPFHSTFAFYFMVNDPITGVLIKLPAEIKANPATGQLTTVSAEDPQLPFSDLKLHFFGGPRAELTTPPNCGIYTTKSELSPWSLEGKELPGEELPATPFDNYTIDSNCAIGFSPAFTGGSTNLQAGAYTTFQASFERQDSDQELGGAEVNLPPGMLADVPSVSECGEAELAAEAADAPTGGCPASSKVGTVQAGAGPGPNPLFVPGNVFWTGPYNGGPFGLAVVVSANPGPFHFGNVLVRQSIRVNPITAAVTDVSDPFPTFLDPRGPDGQVNGIPIKLRRVDIEINRPGFTFNPTSCGKLQVGGNISSTQGAAKALATPFQVTNCQTLKFAPKFAVSTAGKTSKAKGASLHVDLTYPQGPQGTYANITRVKVDLPKQLPSRLTTLQKACTAKQFELNPAGCPKESMIGYATVHTPILPVPLSGPAIFVSHGGEAFPSLIMVLQGDGITLDLVGTTFISKAGITSSTFKTVPDAPVGSFELNLPQGKFSALAANGNLCKSKLAMPTEFLAQNGTKINESTKIGVTGCPKAHKAAQKKGKHKRSSSKRKGH